MKKYSQVISDARLVSVVESDSSTGDLEYSGTALEVSDQSGEELFHVVVDEHGERQFLFFATDHDYRIPLNLLERIVERAKEVVHKVL